MLALALPHGAQNIIPASMCYCSYRCSITSIFSFIYYYIVLNIYLSATVTFCALYLLFAGFSAEVQDLSREIITKAENIQICSDFTKKPVNFFCTDKYQPITLSGKVNGWSRKADADILNVRESSGKNYRIALPPQLLAGAIGNSDPLAIQGKEIQVTTGNIPQQLTDGTFELKLTGARQLRVLATATKTDIK